MTISIDNPDAKWERGVPVFAEPTEFERLKRTE